MNKKFLSIITLTLCLLVCLMSFPVYAAEADRVNKLYSSKIAYGKIFVDGKNEPIKSKNQFDTKITNISISNCDSDYHLKFDFESRTIELTGKIVPGKANNINGDHFMFAPDEFTSDTFTYVTVSITTSANELDVMPANSNLIGSTVLSIIFENNKSHDVYYWQTGLTSESKTSIVFNTSDDPVDIERANEFYYINKTNQVDVCSSSDFNYEEMASPEKCAEMQNRDYSQMARSTNNPYYDLGIPDSTFKTATETWRWLSVGRNVDGEYLPIRYYAYSYTKYGNPNIMTHIMIVGYIFQRDLNYTLVEENYENYAKASGMLKIFLWEDPNTVVYYTDSNTFGFMEGGKYLTHIVEPAVEVKKDSTGIPHVVTARYEYSNATKKGGFLGLGALVLKEVAVGVLDMPSFGFASVLVNIGELMTSYSTSVGATDGFVPVEEYYCSYSNQVYLYGEAMGSIKSRVRGYLQIKNQHLGARVWFATPDEYASSVNNITWVYYVSPDYT